MFFNAIKIKTFHTIPFQGIANYNFRKEDENKNTLTQNYRFVSLVV